MARFDEVELQPGMILPDPSSLEPEATALVEELAGRGRPASRWRRILATVTDLSLFSALSIGLSPLLPSRADWQSALEHDAFAIGALAAFLLLVSFYYFVGSWLLWGKTIGGTIFDVRVVAADEESAMPFASGVRRWAALLLSLALAGLGFVPALLPSRLSLPDRMSGTHCVEA